MNAKRSIAVIALLLLACAVGFQNCSKMNFAASDDSGSPSLASTAKCSQEQVMDSLGNCLSPEQARSACSLNGQIIADGASITTYETSSVPSGAQCQSQIRSCRQGVLSGSWSNLSCAPLQSSLPPTTPSQNCSFNGQTILSGQSVIAYLSSSSSNCQNESRVCKNGVLSGSYLYANCTAPICTPTDVVTAQKSFIQSIKSTETEVAQICVDGYLPNWQDNLPLDGPRYLRFFNTCGNRACKKKGFLSGRVVEDNNGDVELECRHDQIPTNITDSCRQRLASLPKPIEFVTVPDSVVSSSSCDGINPDTLTIDQKQIRWAYKCGDIACKNRGYTAGRSVEYNSGIATLECTREEILNSLSTGTLVNELLVTVTSIEEACVDGYAKTPEESDPARGLSMAVRFHNTCGRRYCKTVGYASGRVTEVIGSLAKVLCLKN